MNEKKTFEQIEDEWFDKNLNPEDKAIGQILTELKKAKAKWPDWVYDPVHAAGILNEEASETVEVLIKLCEKSGKTMQAALDFSYSNGDIERLRIEACQTGAMAIRLLENLDKYERVRTYINNNNQDNEVE